MLYIGKLEIGEYFEHVFTRTKYMKVLEKHEEQPINSHP
jgi:hypothetical protein